MHPKHSEIMARAHRRLLSEAIGRMRRIDYADKPRVYIQEASTIERDLASGCVKRRMLGMPNVSSTIDGASRRYDLRHEPYDETRPLDNTPAAYFLKLYPK